MPYSAGIATNSFTEGCNIFRKSTLKDHIHMYGRSQNPNESIWIIFVFFFKCARQSWWQSKKKKMAAAVGVMGGRESAATFMLLLRNGPPKKNRHLFLMKAAVKALIRNAHFKFNLSSFVQNSGFCFLQVWCLIVSESSGHHVLLTFGIQDLSPYKVFF